MHSKEYGHSGDRTRTFGVLNLVLAINHYTEEAKFDVKKISDKLLEEITLNWQTSEDKSVLTELKTFFS